MPRFFVSGFVLSGKVVLIEGEDAEHIRVLRMKPGEKLLVCDGEGTDYECRLLGESGGAIEAEILSRNPSCAEPDVRCSVFAAFSKGDRMETVIMKAVELGAYEVIPFPSARCVSRPDTGAALAKKAVRWQKIALEAAKQSGRGRVPKIVCADSFASAVGNAAAADAPLFFYEEERALSFKEALDSRSGYKTVSIVTGPEGGFEPCEAEYAGNSGLLVVTMGPRILRCDTAPLCALSAVMFHAGELNRWGKN